MRQDGPPRLGENLAVAAHRILHRFQHRRIQPVLAAHFPGKIELFLRKGAVKRFPGIGQLPVDFTVAVVFHLLQLFQGI